MCHPDAGAEADVSTRLYSMELGQYPPRVWSQCRQHLAVAAQVQNILLHCILNVSTLIEMPCFLLCHGDEAHIVFWVAAGLGMTNNINCVLLSLQSGGQKVSIAHILTVVHTKKKTTGLLIITSAGKNVQYTIWLNLSIDS